MTDFLYKAPLRGGWVAFPQISAGNPRPRMSLMVVIRIDELCEVSKLCE